MRYGKPVKRANILADIAAINTVMKFIQQFAGDSVFFFDGKVGNTFRRGKGVWGFECPGGTGIKAQMAVSAMILLR